MHTSSSLYALRSIICISQPEIAFINIEKIGVHVILVFADKSEAYISQRNPYNEGIMYTTNVIIFIDSRAVQLSNLTYNQLLASFKNSQQKL